MNQCADCRSSHQFYIQGFQKLQEKFEGYFVDIHKLRVSFQFIVFLFDFHVNDGKLTQELAVLFNLNRYNLEIDKLFFKVKSIFPKKDESMFTLKIALPHSV